MIVEARGAGGDGQPVSASWRLNAESNRGPYVPVLAALLLARRWRDGRRPEPGARVCSGMLALDDFQSDFSELGIRTTFESAE